MVMSEQQLPSQAEVVIIGGGIIGTSVAYHLAKFGCKDVVLLERDKLTCGSTFHAAGLVGQLRTSANITQLLKYSVELYDNLAKETGLETGWKMNGGLRLACTPERMTEIRRQATTARSFGLEMHLLNAKEAQELWPIMDISDVLGAAFLPTDGQVNPSDITQSLAKGAKMQGAKIIENCLVESLELNGQTVTAIQTSLGKIHCEKVVNCAGQWAKEIGRMAGVAVPVTSVQHQYLVTEQIEGVRSDLPTLRDPDRLIYFKEEVGGLVAGGYEPNPKIWAKEGIPENFIFSLLNPDWDHFEPLMNQMIKRAPAMEQAGVRELINGPEAFTPDGNFILGEAPNVKNFFVGAGFNAFGIASAGGAGKALAEWIIEGHPTMDLWTVDIARFHKHHGNDDWVDERTLELYGKHYTIAWPHEEHHSSRGLRISPLYETLKNQNACFGEKLGWERPNWFAPANMEPKDVPSMERANWFPIVKEEHIATRESVTLFDQSSFAKFLMVGKDAEEAMSWICANDVRKPGGSIIYTQMCNDRGGIECDLTVNKMDDGRFYIVTGTGFATHDFKWINQNIPEGLDAKLIDVTSAYGTLSLMGPKAREVLQAVTQNDLSHEAFPFATCQPISIGGAMVKALRVTYVGELGWELHIPSECLSKVYQLLMKAGQDYGIRNAGYRAIESLRLEKGYRAWSSDITPDHTPFEAGMGWAVKLKTDVPFIGREALEYQQRMGVSKKLACFTVDDPNVILLGRESIYRNDQLVGWLTSGGYGYTVEKNIGYGYVRSTPIVDKDFVMSGDYTLEVATKRVSCQVHLSPLFDPKMEKIKC